MCLCYMIVFSLAYLIVSVRWVRCLSIIALVCCFVCVCVCVLFMDVSACVCVCVYVRVTCVCVFACICAFVFCVSDAV